MESVKISDLPSQTYLSRIQKSKAVKQANALMKSGLSKEAAILKSVSSVNIQKAAGEEEMISYEIIYEPFTPDAHNQWISADEIVKAKASYDKALENGLVKENLFHLEETDSFTITKTWIQEELDVSVTGTGEIIKAGSWVAKVKYNDPSLWELRKAGIIGGLSIQCGAMVNDETGELTDLDFSAKIAYIDNPEGDNS